jgi:hypothetical protein
MKACWRNEYNKREGSALSFQADELARMFGLRIWVMDAIGNRRKRKKAILFTGWPFQY